MCQKEAQEHTLQQVKREAKLEQICRCTNKQTGSTTTYENYDEY